MKDWKFIEMIAKETLFWRRELGVISTFDMSMLSCGRVAPAGVVHEDIWM